MDNPHQSYSNKNLKKGIEYSISLNAKTNHGLTNLSNQHVSTTSDMGLPAGLKKGTTNIIQSEEFKDAKTLADFSAQLQNLTELKKLAINHNIDEFWMEMLVLTTEFKDFVEKIEVAFRAANQSKTDKEVCKGKITELLIPLHKKKTSSSSTMHILLSIVHGPYPKETEDPKEEIKSFSDLIKSLEQCISNNREETSTHLSYLISSSTFLKSNHIGYEIIQIIRDNTVLEKIEGKSETNFDSLILILNELNQKIFSEKNLKHCLINGLKILFEKVLKTNKEEKIHMFLKKVNVEAKFKAEAEVQAGACNAYTHTHTTLFGNNVCIHATPRGWPVCTPIRVLHDLVL